MSSELNRRQHTPRGTLLKQGRAEKQPRLAARGAAGEAAGRGGRVVHLSGVSALILPVIQPGVKLEMEKVKSSREIAKRSSLR